jgi:hypothetical protein
MAFNFLIFLPTFIKNGQLFQNSRRLRSTDILCPFSFMKDST